MANPLSNEAELFARIQTEKIGVDPLIWDAIYRHVGDSVSVINLVVSYFIEYNELIPIEDSKEILKYSQNIKEVFDKIIHPDRIKDDVGIFCEIRDKKITIHPLIAELFTHYIANDNCAINFCVSYYLDPGYEEPIPVAEAQKILNHAKSMCSFLEKLRTATLKAQGY